MSLNKQTCKKASDKYLVYNIKVILYIFYINKNI